MERGLDSHFAPNEAGPALFQAKYAIQPWEEWPTLGLGTANVATNSDDWHLAGGEFKFAVLSHDFKWLRLHAGYGIQPDNNAMFFGADKTVKVFNRDLMLRTDAIQIQDQSQWLASFGGIYFLHKHIAASHGSRFTFPRRCSAACLMAVFIVPFQTRLW